MSQQRCKHGIAMENPCFECDEDRAEKVARPLRKPHPLTNWHVYHVNCDCSSYTHAWMRMPRAGTWRRCIGCKKQLGDMELTYKGKVRARTESEALRLV